MNVEQVDLGVASLLCWVGATWWVLKKFKGG